MHFTILTSLVGAALFAAGGVQAAGDFSASCSRFWLQNNSIMYATCSDGRGGINTSSLNLNACIVNRNGNLVCAAK
jgi:hypothetical protein